MSAQLDHFRAATPHCLEIEGSTVTYRRFGDGPALVFVHGWPLSGVTFRGLVHELVEADTCYVLDLPGAGESPWNPAIRDIFQDFGRLVAGFVRELGLEQTVLVGHDSGGTIARIAASLEPQRVCGLMLCNTECPGHHLDTIEGFQKLSRLPGAPMLFKMLLRSRLYLRSSLGFGGCFADENTVEGEFFETTVLPLRRDPRGALAQLRNANLDVVDQLAELHARLHLPVLLVWGDSDPFFPLHQAREMARDWDAPVCLEVIEGHRLLVHEDAAPQVAGHMRRFLSAHLQTFPRRVTSA